uniref:VWFC domain-containing protein n=1 Tax=Glossina brevipalpis TaxID=37001 RepID=A0A1A9WDI8_9MUSC
MVEKIELECSQVQCASQCPIDSYLKSMTTYEDVEDDADDEFEDYEGSWSTSFLYDHHINMEESDDEINKSRKRRNSDHDNVIKCCGDNVCICRKCDEVPICPQGQVAVEVFKGQGKPGNCCSSFQCVKKVDCSSLVKQTYWKSLCTTCRCFGEHELCENHCPEEELLQNCYSEYLQKPMINGARWKEGKCVSCSCEAGEKRCLTSVCPKLECNNVRVVANVCCPKCINETKHTFSNSTEQNISTEPNNFANTISTTAVTKVHSTTGVFEHFEETVENSSSAMENNVTPFTNNDSSLEDLSPNLTISQSLSKDISAKTTATTSIVFPGYNEDASSKNFETTDSSSAAASTSGSTILNYLWSVATTESTFTTTKATYFKENFVTFSARTDVTTEFLIDTFTHSTSIEHEHFPTSNSNLPNSAPSSTTLYLTPSTTTLSPSIKSNIATTISNSTSNSNKFTFVQTAYIPTTPSTNEIVSFHYHQNKSLLNSQNLNHPPQVSYWFHKIEYIIMITLFVGSSFCIVLGLIIRHNKNRKKMYSCIPNSETSLSQTSTNTVLTV